MSNPEIYVACLASYNAGNLFGEWIEVDESETFLEDQISALLRKSKYPSVKVDCPDCVVDPDCSTCKGKGEVPSAEEWAIHDSRGFEGYKPGESTKVDTLCKVASLLEQYGAVFTSALDYFGDIENASSALKDRYCGEWNSVADYAADYANEADSELMAAMPNRLRYFIDWDQYASWLDLTAIDSGCGTVYIFTDS
jgi:antirestriction protein